MGLRQQRDKDKRTPKSSGEGGGVRQQRDNNRSAQLIIGGGVGELIHQPFFLFAFRSGNICVAGRNGGRNDFFSGYLRKADGIGWISLRHEHL